MSFADLLPRPREIEPRPGTCPAALAADPKVGRFTPPPHAEGYVLEIAPTGVTIAATDAAGDFYARQTLDLLRQDGTDLPCGVIRDWPALARRGVYIDLKGYQPKFEKLLEHVRLMARYKVNTILLEIEDKYAFACAPDVGIPDAYTADQLRQLSRLCHDLHIQLIPKLQCLGHVDYILKHPRYHALRENNHPFQFCPLHPDTFELWEAMAAELMACFPEHAYFHVGADETKHLGECDRCRQHRKGRLYLDHVGRCVDFIAAAGKQPILWDDILRNLHGTLADEDLPATWALGEKAILMYWAYGYGGKDNVFPFLARYRERGLRVWGASGYSGSGESWFQNVPSLRHRAWNIAAWTAAARQHHLEGVMCTSWTRIISFYPPDEIPEACWFNILYAADSMWFGQERTLPEHGRVVAVSLFGALLPEVAEFLVDLDHAKLPRHPEKTGVTRHIDRYRLLTAAMALVDHEHIRQRGWMNMYELLHAHHGLLGHAATDYALALFRERVGVFRDSLAKRSAALKSAMDAFYELSTVEEVMRSRFGRDHDLLRELDSLIAKTAEV